MTAKGEQAASAPRARPAKRPRQAADAEEAAPRGSKRPAPSSALSPLSHTLGLAAPRRRAAVRTLSCSEEEEAPPAPAHPFPSPHFRAGLAPPPPPVSPRWIVGLMGGEGGLDSASQGGSGASTLAQPSPAGSDGGGGAMEDGRKLCSPPWTSQEEVQKARARALHRINSFEFCAVMGLVEVNRETAWTVGARGRVGA